MTLEQHLSQNREQIEREAPAYAERYRVTLERARKEIADEFAQGWYEAADNARYE